MRPPIASALLVMFGLVFFAHSASAQSSPIPSQPQPVQQAPQKPPSSAKFMPPPPATQIVLLPKQDGSASDPTITLHELRTWIQTQQNRKDGPGLMRFGDGPECLKLRTHPDYPGAGNGFRDDCTDVPWRRRPHPNVPGFAALPPRPPCPDDGATLLWSAPHAAGSVTHTVRATSWFPDSVRPTTARTAQARQPQRETLSSSTSSKAIPAGQDTLRGGQSTKSPRGLGTSAPTRRGGAL